MPGIQLKRRHVLEAGVAAAAGAVLGVNGPPLRKRGFNMVETPNAPFGSALAAASFERLASTGANSVALVSFFWQSDPASPDIVPGSAVPAERLRAGISQARSAGLEVLVKPHVWVPDRWAGAIRMANTEDWARWFDAYASALEPVADIAREEGACALSIGTELLETTRHPQWREIIAEARSRFGGTLTYVAHWRDEAARVDFWGDLDAVSVSLYPPLGAPDDVLAWQEAMAAELGSARNVAMRAGKPLWLAEIGLRSAAGATLRPWESAEERAAPVNLALQADVIAAWLAKADQFGAEGAFVWRWLSDPHGGGPGDTDFTVQNKPAEAMLRRHWLRT